MEEFPEMSVFRAWLEARVGLVVGRTCSVGLCPLAGFLNDAWGGSWSVGVSTYRNEQWEVLEALPAWAGAFVWGLDSAYGIEREVSGQQALDVLSELGVVVGEEGE